MGKSDSWKAGKNKRAEKIKWLQGDSLTEKNKGEEVSKSEQSEKGITEEEGLGLLSPS